ncbi:hypothetical protein DFJ74DRAFT_763780 [Hyaloraphidium curvatum]|nr:hypothetical protein DFJ74DRAFT_763780 [Hyaloraphidium curvatum]
MGAMSNDTPLYNPNEEEDRALPFPISDKLADIRDWMLPHQSSRGGEQTPRRTLCLRGFSVTPNKMAHLPADLAAPAPDAVLQPVFLSSPCAAAGRPASDGDPAGRPRLLPEILLNVGSLLAPGSKSLLEMMLSCQWLYVALLPHLMSRFSRYWLPWERADALVGLPERNGALRLVKNLDLLSIRAER